MTPTTMRLFWELVNESQPSQLLRMDDDGLLNWLLERVRQIAALDRQQERDLSMYIISRLPLIRDIAANH